MLIAMMVVFAVLGLALGGYQAYRRRWLEAARWVLGCSVAIATYASTLLHQPAIGAVASVVVIAAAIAYVILSRRAADRAPAGSAQS